MRFVWVKIDSIQTAIPAAIPATIPATIQPAITPAITPAMPATIQTTIAAAIPATIPTTNPATIRYAYEKETVPEMLEEANAQGVAVGTTEALGLGNQEMAYDKPTDYPESFGRRGVELLNQNFSPMFEGAPLGIGITGTPAVREEYYRIQDNIPSRVQRGYLKGKSLVQ